MDHFDSPGLRRLQAGTTATRTRAWALRVVVAAAHRDHAEVCERSALARGGDFVPISVNDPILEKGPVLVAAKAGDLILWDSRTVHCNTPGWAPEAEGMPFTQCAQMEEWQLLREVGYVCMTPAAWASDETLEQRRKAFEEGISTSHWPHKFAIAGYPLPGMPPNDPQSISQEQRRLIGYDRPRTWPCRDFGTLLVHAGGRWKLWREREGSVDLHHNDDHEIYSGYPSKSTSDTKSLVVCEAG
eukprot:g13163.t1